MKNTWAESVETRNVCRKMDEQSDILQSLYGSDRTGFEEAVGNICKITIDEFWRPEAFEEEDYCRHMMYWKEALENAVPKQVLNNLVEKPISFNFVIRLILDQIEFYHSLYSGLWEDGVIRVHNTESSCSEFACGCPMCWGPITNPPYLITGNSN